MNVPEHKDGVFMINNGISTSTHNQNHKDEENNSNDELLNFISSITEEKTDFDGRMLPSLLAENMNKQDKIVGVKRRASTPIEDLMLDDLSAFDPLGEDNWIVDTNIILDDNAHFNDINERDISYSTPQKHISILKCHAAKVQGGSTSRSSSALTFKSPGAATYSTKINKRDNDTSLKSSEKKKRVSNPASYTRSIGISQVPLSAVVTVFPERIRSARLKAIAKSNPKEYASINNLTVNSNTATIQEVDINGKPVIRIGAYTVEERKKRIAAWREKRGKRVWTKRVSYDCRKELADYRPREKGRFVKVSGLSTGPSAPSSDADYKNPFLMKSSFNSSSSSLVPSTNETPIASNI